MQDAALSQSAPEGKRLFRRSRRRETTLRRRANGSRWVIAPDGFLPRASISNAEERRRTAAGIHRDGFIDG